MEYKYSAVVMSKIDVAETDRIYTAYTKEAGKIRLLAKGVRKPNAKLAANLEPVTSSEIFLARTKGIGKITGAIGLNSFLELKETILALEKVFYAFRIFDRLVTEEEKDERIFDLVSGYLGSMNELSQKSKSQDSSLLTKSELVTAGFLFKLLSFLGYSLEVKKCVRCRRNIEKGENYFSAEAGGVICPACGKNGSRKIRINESVIKLIRIFLGNRIENFRKLNAGKNDLNNLKLVLNEEVGWIIG